MLAEEPYSLQRVFEFKLLIFIKIIKSFDFEAFFHINLCTFSRRYILLTENVINRSLTSYPQEDETSNGEVNNHDT
jgi:hypothetical protein